VAEPATWPASRAPAPDTTTFHRDFTAALRRGGILCGMPHIVDRRGFLKGTALTMGALAMGPAFWKQALAQSPATPGVGPYGPLGAADPLGIALPQGFSSRLIAAAGSPVVGTGFVWPLFPDGSATFAQPDGGYVLAVNTEVPSIGGASSISFDKDGNVTGARSILQRTSTNCGGGATPWGTWLSCEETDTGRVWECDPLGAQDAVVRPALGVFTHEAAVVDPVGKRVYMTEDEGDSGFYRFTPDRYPDLSAGILEIAVAGTGETVRWVPVPDPLFERGTPTRMQVPESLKFKRGEGMWFDTGVVYFTSTSDDRIWAYECATERLALLYDGVALGDGAPLKDPDAITVHPPSGDLFVGEDADDLQVVLVTAQREVAPFLQLSGPLHGAETEIAGVTFDPSGRRLYFSSQRGGVATGMTFEVTGPFRAPAAPASALPPSMAPPAAGAVPRPIAVRAKPAVRVTTLRRDGLLVGFDADRAGTYLVRVVVRVGGRAVTVARAERKVAAGRYRARVRVPESAVRRLAALRGRRIEAQVVVTSGRRRVTRPIELTRGG